MLSVLLVWFEILKLAESKAIRKQLFKYTFRRPAINSVGKMSGKKPSTG